MMECDRLANHGGGGVKEKNIGCENNFSGIEECDVKIPSKMYCPSGGSIVVLRGDCADAVNMEIPFPYRCDSSIVIPERKKLFSYLTFRSASHAKRFVRNMGGKGHHVRLSSELELDDEIVFVHNLPSGVKIDHIFNAIGSYGQILEVRLGLSRLGFDRVNAFIKLENPVAALKAIAFLDRRFIPDSMCEIVAIMGYETPPSADHDRKLAMIDNRMEALGVGSLVDHAPPIPAYFGSPGDQENMEIFRAAPFPQNLMGQTMECMKNGTWSSPPLMNSDGHMGTPNEEVIQCVPGIGASCGSSRTEISGSDELSEPCSYSDSSDRVHSGFDEPRSEAVESHLPREEKPPDESGTEQYQGFQRRFFADDMPTHQNLPSPNLNRRPSFSQVTAGGDNNRNDNRSQGQHWNSARRRNRHHEPPPPPPITDPAKLRELAYIWRLPFSAEVAHACQEGKQTDDDGNSTVSHSVDRQFER